MINNHKVVKYFYTYITPLFCKRRRAKKNSRTILIFKTDGLGDFFLLVPLIQNLIAYNYNVVCVGNASSGEIATHCKCAIRFIPLTNKSVNDFKKVIKTILEYDFEYAFNLSMNIWGGIIVNQSRANVKIGLLQEREHYVYKGAKLFYDTILSYNQSMHTFDVLKRVFTDTMGIGSAYEFIEFQETHDHNYIAIHSYANWRPRIWPYFKELIMQLLDRNVTIHLLGTAKEHAGNTWLSEIKDSRLSVIALSSIDHLMTEIDHATAFIGNDSGPAHYASLIGKNTIVIWGPGFFERIHPVGKNVTFCKIAIECRPCRQKGNVCIRGDNDCLKKISVDDVLAVVDGSMPEHSVLSTPDQL